MWNPFRKSKVTKLKEVIAESVLNYCINEVQKETDNNLKNKDIDALKFYQLLVSKPKILITKMYNPNEWIGFVHDWKYDIKRIDNIEYEISIDGILCVNPDFVLERMPIDIMVNFLNVNGKNIYVYGRVGSIMNNTSLGENLSLEIGLTIRIPFKEEKYIKGE